MHVFKFKRKLQLENQFTSKQKTQVREGKITRNVKHYKRQIWVSSVQLGIGNAIGLEPCTLVLEVKICYNRLDEPFYWLDFASIYILDAIWKSTLKLKDFLKAKRQEKKEFFLMSVVLF